MAKAQWSCKPIDFFRGETQSDAFRKNINAMGEAPVLQHGDTKLSQSALILEYFNHKVGNYWGSTDDEAQQIKRWLLWDNAKFSAYHGITRFLLHFKPHRIPNDPVTQFFQSSNERYFKVLDCHLQGKQWIANNKFSAADIACCSYLFYPETFGFDPNQYPHIQQWLDRIQNQPRWAPPYDLLPKMRIHQS